VRPPPVRSKRQWAEIADREAGSGQREDFLPPGNASGASYGKMASLVTAETLEGAMVAKRYSDQFRQGLS
jgi:hypothetical protein